MDALYPEAISSHSTAVLLVPQNKVVHITANVKVRKKIAVSDLLSIEVHPGDVHPSTQPFVPQLFRSSPARYLLENLQRAHKDVSARKALGREWVEEELCKILQKYGEKELNHIREEARDYAKHVGAASEFKQLDTLIGALLTTRPIKDLKTLVAIATAGKEPFDLQRINLFQQLFEYLQRCDLPVRTYQYNRLAWRNLAFYESYFSNYIEDTEFEIAEAEQIVFEKREINNRHQDSHDVLSVFEVVHDYSEMSQVPDNAGELLALMRQRHELIMDARPEKRPGQLKLKANKAADTLFVSPEELEGTLTRSFNIYRQLTPGITRAIFMQFLITECHPFDDGNGRLARIMMNAELLSAGQHKIIVPTVHRDSYLNGLRQATRSARFRTMTKVFADLQAYTSSLAWTDYGEVENTLEAHCANKLPDDGIAVFNRELSKRKALLPAG